VRFVAGLPEAANNLYRRDEARSEGNGLKDEKLTLIHKVRGSFLRVRAAYNHSLYATRRLSATTTAARVCGAGSDRLDRRGEDDTRAGSGVVLDFELEAAEGTNVCIHDGSTVLYASAAFTRLVGAPSSLVGRSMSSLVHPADYEAMRERVAAGIRGECVEPIFRGAMVREDGSLVVVDVLVSFTTWKGVRSVRSTLSEVAKSPPRRPGYDPEGVRLGWLLRICLALPATHEARTRWSPPLVEALALRPPPATAYGPN